MKHSIFLVLSILLTAGTLLAREQTLPATGTVDTSPEVQAVTFSDARLEDRLDRGLRNAEFYSYHLIDKAHNEPAHVSEYLAEALRYSPDLPAVYFHLAWVTITSTPNHIFESVSYFVEGINAYKRNFWWTFNLTGILSIGLLLSFLLSILVTAFVRLPVDLPLVNHEIKEDGKNFLLFVVVFFISALGPLFFLASVLLLVSYYFKKADRALAYFYFGVLLLLPLFLKPVDIFLSAEMSPSLKAIVEVNEGKDNRYAIDTLAGDEGKEALFSYALALKREGKIPQSIEGYTQLLEKDPRNAMVYNNLGNCYALSGQIAHAEAMYKKAIEMRPLASAYYNLSNVSNELLKFEEGGRYFDEAKKIDPEAVSHFREIPSQDPKRLFVDETLDKITFWKYAFRSSGTRLVHITFLPLWFTPVIGLMIIISFVAFSKMRKNKAFSCKRCGTIICTKCERSLKWGGMCHDCFVSLVTFEKDPRDRISKLMTVYDKKKSRKFILMFLAIFIPGAHLTYAGKVVKGTILSFLFLAPVILFLVSLAYRISIYPYTHSWLLFMAIVFTAFFYMINIIATRRLLKKWV